MTLQCQFSDYLPEADWSCLCEQDVHNIAAFFVVDGYSGVSLVPNLRDCFKVEDGSELEHVAVLDASHDIFHALLFVFQSTCHNINLLLFQVVICICHLEIQRQKILA